MLALTRVALVVLLLAVISLTASTTLPALSTHPTPPPSRTAKADQGDDARTDVDGEEPMPHLLSAELLQYEIVELPAELSATPWQDEQSFRFGHMAADEFLSPREAFQRFGQAGETQSETQGEDAAPYLAVRVPHFVLSRDVFRIEGLELQDDGELVCNLEYFRIEEYYIHPNSKKRRVPAVAYLLLKFDRPVKHVSFRWPTHRDYYSAYRAKVIEERIPDLDVDVPAERLAGLGEPVQLNADDLRFELVTLDRDELPARWGNFWQETFLGRIPAGKELSPAAAFQQFRTRPGGEDASGDLYLAGIIEGGIDCTDKFEVIRIEQNGQGEVSCQVAQTQGHKWPAYGYFLLKLPPGTQHASINFHERKNEFGIARPGEVRDVHVVIDADSLASTPWENADCVSPRNLQFQVLPWEQGGVREQELRANWRFGRLSAEHRLAPRDAYDLFGDRGFAEQPITGDLYLAGIVPGIMTNGDSFFVERIEYEAGGNLRCRVMYHRDLDENHGPLGIVAFFLLKIERPVKHVLLDFDQRESSSFPGQLGVPVVSDMFIPAPRDLTVTEQHTVSQDPDRLHFEIVPKAAEPKEHQETPQEVFVGRLADENARSPLTAFEKMRTMSRDEIAYTGPGELYAAIKLASQHPYVRACDRIDTNWITLSEAGRLFCDVTHADVFGEQGQQQKAADVYCLLKLEPGVRSIEFRIDAVRESGRFRHRLRESELIDGFEIDLPAMLSVDANSPGAERERAQIMFENWGGTIFNQFEFLRQHPELKDLLEHPERIEQGSTVAVLDSWQGTDEDLTLIHKLGHVRKVSLQSPRVTDAGLRALESLPDVKKFHISNCRISADGIGLLAGIPSLQQITLLDTPVSNTACNDLAQLPELKALWIGEGQLLTEAGLAALAQSSSIEILEIDRLTLSAGVVENGGLSIDRAPMDNPPGNTCTTRIILRGEFDVLALAHFCQRFEKLAVLDLNGAFIANGNVEDLRRMLPGVQIDNQPAAWGPIDCWK